ncbi:MAG: hypothetical protein KDD99_26620, partial [Bacteroidetes bacterium]|nr:hypothetical protein [Bacteroidota bacterium]
MVEQLLAKIPMKTWRLLALAGIAIAVLGSIGMALRLHIWPLYAVPVMLVVGMQVIYNYQPLFYMMIFSIPFSMQLEFGTSVAIDVFS